MSRYQIVLTVVDEHGDEVLAGTAPSRPFPEGPGAHEGENLSSLIDLLSFAQHQNDGRGENWWEFEILRSSKCNFFEKLMQSSLMANRTWLRTRQLPSEPHNVPSAARKGLRR